MPESRALVAHLAGKADRNRSLAYGAWFDAVIGPTARVGPFATVDGGWKACTRVDGWVFAHAHVGHDAVVEEGAEVSTHAVIGGHAVVERGARVGLGAVVLPFKRIGAGAIVGAGAVVTRDVPAGGVWAGNPARFMRDVDQQRPVHVDPEWYARWAAKWSAQHQCSVGFSGNKRLRCELAQGHDGVHRAGAAHWSNDFAWENP